jgi:uncharacterized protein (DUF1015 family)
MARVKPFEGLRPIPEKVSEVTSPPYDVLSSEEAREKAKGNPCSFLHVVKPEIDLDPSIDVCDPAVYEKGAENLRRLIDEGIMVQDPKPNFYIYKLRMGDREQIGLVAGASVEEYDQNRIKKHEFTRKDKEQDRVNHIDHLNAQTGPVFLTYRSSELIDRLIEKGMERDPVYDFVGDYDVQHTFYVVDDENLVQEIQDGFADIDALYVADGHHRSASASRVQKARIKKNPNHTGEEEYNYFLSVIFPDSQMLIMDYNRAVKDLNNRSVEEVLSLISEKFEVNPSSSCCEGAESCGEGAFKPRKMHEFGMYLMGKWYCLTAKDGSFEASNPIENLDVSILQKNLLEPVLDIGDPRTDNRISFVGGIRGLSELEKLVDSGEYGVAFALYPTSIEQLLSVADADKVMPPKSTWFEPKLRSGVVVHLLD